MKHLLTILFCAAVSVASSKAANVAWVSIHPTGGTASGAATTAGFTEAPDIGYTQLLANNGYAVTRFTSLDNAGLNAATLNTFDLVIVSRSSPSGHFQDAAERVFWNTTITAPLMHLGGYLLRANRLGFTSANNMPDTVGNVSLLASVPNHPIFAGIALDGGNSMVNFFSGETSFNSIVQRGISINSDPLAGGGTLIASITAGTAVDNNTLRGTGATIAEWSAGSVLQNGDILGGNRLVFLTGSRENAGLTSDGAGIYDLVGDGPAMFLNAVEYMAVPEPSTGILLGFGALALLLRRKRA